MRSFAGNKPDGWDDGYRAGREDLLREQANATLAAAPQPDGEARAKAVEECARKAEDFAVVWERMAENAPDAAGDFLSHARNLRDLAAALRAPSPGAR